METKIVLIVLIVVILVILARCVRVVQQSKAYVIERLGAFHTVWSVGLHFKVPFIDRVLRVVSLKEQVADFPPQPVITKDNVTMQIDTVLYYQITDPKLFAYGVENPMNAIENLTATTLRNIIGELELEARISRVEILEEESDEENVCLLPNLYEDLCDILVDQEWMEYHDPLSIYMAYKLDEKPVSETLRRDRCT